jgi:pyruvate formate lyase activating enzyme
MNLDIYKEYSGISNERVIDNLKWIATEHPDLLSNIKIRLPHIPNYNIDDDRNKSQAFLETLGYTNFDRFEYIIR